MGTQANHAVEDLSPLTVRAQGLQLSRRCEQLQRDTGAKSVCQRARHLTQVVV